MAYQVDVHLDGPGWVVVVPELGVGRHVGRLAQVEDAARALVAAAAGLPGAEVEVALRLRVLGGGVPTAA